MIIYNRTNQLQELRVCDRDTSRWYNIYICANSHTELNKGLVVPELQKLVREGIFQVVGVDLPKAPNVKSLEDTSPESKDTNNETNDHEEAKDTGNEVEDTTSEVISPEGSQDSNGEVEETTGTEVESTTEETPVTEEVQDTEEKDVTKFICKICGGEYASARGLANHMNKSHKE